MTLQTGWHVVRKVPLGRNATGGNFSTGYIVERDGSEAFMKAMDIHALFRQEPNRLMEVMQHVSGAYLHEKQLLEACAEYRMDRVVQTLEAAEQVLDPADPASVVFYFVFEVAEGDIRQQHAAADTIDLQLVFSTLHCVTVGIKQLHTAEITHQDIKPSNVLSFKEAQQRVSRIGDLGRASTPEAAMPHDVYPCAGDRSYWPPEALFDSAPPTWDGRRACDLFQLGSLLLFLFTGVNATAALLNALPVAYVPHSVQGPYTGSFEDALPALRGALNDVCDQFVDLGNTELQARTVRILRELCAPNPDERGHPRSRGDRWSVERYITEFDLLARRCTYGRRVQKPAA